MLFWPAQEARRVERADGSRVGWVRLACGIVISFSHFTGVNVFLPVLGFPQAGPTIHKLAAHRESGSAARRPSSPPPVAQAWSTLPNDAASGSAIGSIGSVAPPVTAGALSEMADGPTASRSTDGSASSSHSSSRPVCGREERDAAPDGILGCQERTEPSGAKGRGSAGTW